jgi:ABC-type multidrug transport system fused ATPase/permease subunit
MTDLEKVRLDGREIKSLKNSSMEVQLGTVQQNGHACNYAY